MDQGEHKENVDYWNDFYKNKFFIREPTTAFACTSLPYLESGKKLVDIGCGAGRDSLFFYQNELNVLGVYASGNQLTPKGSAGRASYVSLRRFYISVYRT